jgi:hypothetical protein
MDIAGSSHKPGKADFEGLVTWILVVFFVFIFASIEVRPDVLPVLLWVMLGAMVVPAVFVCYRAWRQHRESTRESTDDAA